MGYGTQSRDLHADLSDEAAGRRCLGASMTIGAPLNKHIVMWPNLWQGLRPARGRSRQDPIFWRNYYDYGDPVGFDLEITREWMQDNDWMPEEGAAFFQFGNAYDYGFTRYPFPGKAHNDYWNDDQVFGHLVLANAGFLYLWWLSALLFDLVYIWHRFICSYRTTEILRALRKHAPENLIAQQEVG